MNILIAGIPENLFNCFIKSKLEIYSPNYHLAPSLDETANKIRERIDLVVFSGGEYSDYDEFYNLVRINVHIPSIFVIPNSQPGVMDIYSNIHPPNVTLYLNEFSRLQEDQFNYIIQGNDLDWGMSC